MTSTISANLESDYFLQLASPIGRIEIVSDGANITGLTIECGGLLPRDNWPARSNPVLAHAKTQLDEYFAGRRQHFDLPLKLSGTSFQHEIWAGLQQLPWGAVISYGELGATTGRPTAGRAVGGAVGANPIPILVPCHRVLASNARITGYSGGEGIPTKVWLLKHEEIAYRP
jgi:methylated-DNA-[protein]-cysteine S-methyltransferase